MDALGSQKRWSMGLIPSFPAENQQAIHFPLDRTMPRHPARDLVLVRETRLHCHAGFVGPMLVDSERQRSSKACPSLVAMGLTPADLYCLWRRTIHRVLGATSQRLTRGAEFRVFRQFVLTRAPPCKSQDAQGSVISGLGSMNEPKVPIIGEKFFTIQQFDLSGFDLCHLPNVWFDGDT